MDRRDEQFDGAPTDADLRVIAVGDTGVERALRADPGLELVRVRDALHALGELGAPIDDESPEDAVVLLGRGAVAPDELQGFLRAVRRVHAGARVAAIEGACNGAGDQGPLRLDATLPRELSPGHVRLLAADRSEPEPEPEAAPVEPAAAGPASDEPDPPAAPEAEVVFAPEPAPPPGERNARRDALRAILVGDDLVSASLASIGDERIRFVDKESGEPRPQDRPGERVVDVAHRGTRFGWLLGPDDALEAMRDGAEDLGLCIAVQRQQAQLRRSAFTDHLTGAWNRRYFESYLEACVRDARVHRRDLTLLLFDLDDFKHYNDSYGHGAGDEILVETVRLLSSVIRPTDRVCRIGGDEFAVIFYDPSGPREPGSNPPQSLYDIAKRFQRQICDHRFPKLGERAKGKLTISGGLAAFPWDGHDASSLVDHADRLALESKREGKNAIRLGPGAARASAGESPAG